MSIQAINRHSETSIHISPQHLPENIRLLHETIQERAERCVCPNKNTCIKRVQEISAFSDERAIRIKRPESIASMAWHAVTICIGKNYPGRPRTH